jgi:hypothetical protein
MDICEARSEKQGAGSKKRVFSGFTLPATVDRKGN